MPIALLPQLSLAQLGKETRDGSKLEDKSTWVNPIAPFAAEESKK